MANYDNIIEMLRILFAKKKKYYAMNSFTFINENRDFSFAYPPEQSSTTTTKSFSFYQW